MDRLLAWAFIIIVIENQRKWCKSTKNRQKNFAPTAFCNTYLLNQIQNYIISPMAQPTHSIYPPIAPAFLRENSQALRKFFIHHGKIMHTFEHSLRLSEVSPTLGYTLSMVVSWEISTYGFSTLRFLIFSHFPSFCPFVAFRLQAPLMEVSLTTGSEEQVPPSSATESSSVTHYIAINSIATSLHFDLVFLPSLSSLQSHFSQS